MMKKQHLEVDKVLHIIVVNLVYKHLAFFFILALGSFSVQSSYKLRLPPHLIIQSSTIQMTETIGHG